MMRTLEGKNAIVTGANRGLGKGILEGLAKEGCSIWAIIRKPSTEFDDFIYALNINYHVEIKPVYADLSSEDSIKDAYKKINAEKRSIDILINNAGIGHMGWLQLTKLQFIKDLYAVNVFAPMILSQLVLRNMARQNYGRIINVASTAASEVYEGNSIYGSSKAALVAFTKSFAAEVFQYGVTVNAIAPGLINTDMSAVFEGNDPTEPIRHTALGRKIETSEIANVVLDLLSDNMNIINGTVITIHGGHK